MLKEFIIEHCAPTLAGIKTGNAFSVHDNRAEIIEEMREINALLNQKGLRLLPIKKTEKYMLIYIYRPARLRKDLSTPEAIDILAEKGYDCCNPEFCLAQLVRHLNDDKDFPHEIGLFLGYPPEDVKCFMQNPCNGVKCVGCWKAYNNQEEAAKIFERYQKCTEVYKREAVKGRPFEELVVAEPEESEVCA